MIARAMPVVALLLMAMPSLASAQRDTATVARDSSAAHALSCPASGTTLRAWTNGGDSATAPTTGAARRALASSVPLDTTFRLAIADRTWSRDNVDAGVALGAGGTAGARNAPWHACAGASAHLGTVTATLHQVNGTIHLRADPGALDSIGRSHGSTPPAGSPRR